MVVNQYYVITVRRNHLTVERVIFSLGDRIQSACIKCHIQFRKRVCSPDVDTRHGTAIHIALSRHATDHPNGAANKIADLTVATSIFRTNSEGSSLIEKRGGKTRTRTLPVSKTRHIGRHNIDLVAAGEQPGLTEWHLYQHNL